VIGCPPAILRGDGDVGKQNGGKKNKTPAIRKGRNRATPTNPLEGNLTRWPKGGKAF